MVKCDKAKKGDDCFNKEFKNSAMLKVHLTHKHKEKLSVETPKEEVLEITKEELGFTDEEKAIAENEANNDVIGICSDCGVDVYAGQTACSNCEKEFE